MALYSYGPLKLWPHIVMAYTVMAYIGGVTSGGAAAVAGGGRWTRGIFMALYSYCLNMYALYSHGLYSYGPI